MQSTTDPSLNGTFRIQFDGQLILPYSVTQNIFENETPITLGQLKERCLKAYRPFFSKQPSIQLSIKERKFWIETKGLVQKPGSYLISPTNTLDQIISMTGGVTQTPAPKFARIENGSKLFWVNIADFYKQGRVEGMPPWSGGEKIVFQTEAPEGASTGLLEGSRKINILGEVKSPGEQSFTKETDVYAYLVKTGGPTQAADLDRVELIRKDPTTGLNTPIALGPISSIKDIQDSDIMIVHAQRQTTFEKVLQSSAIIASVVSSIALTYIAIHQFKGK
jgi:protein involved in polysaccharide export with SLBB domain